MNMDWESKQQIKESISIIKSNFSLLLLPIVLGVFLFIPHNKGNITSLSFPFPMIALFIVSPLIYGQYVEIIVNRRKTSYVALFNMHWFNYFFVGIMLGIPALLINLLAIFIHEYTVSITFLLGLIVNGLSIYVYPLVFILRKRLKPISLGLKCMLGNFYYSIPLLILAIMPSVLGQAIGQSFGGHNNFTYIAFSYFFWCFNIILDFIVFIAATLILNRKLLNS